MQIYTEEQLGMLSTTFAIILHEALITDTLPFITDMCAELHKEVKKFPWFRYAEPSGKILGHLEDLKVYGVYRFPLDLRPSLYLHLVYSEQFAAWTTRKRPELDKFLKHFGKAKPRKPTENEIRARNFNFSPGRRQQNKTPE